MIVVIGTVHLRGAGPSAAPGGLAGRVAAAAAIAGAEVELVSKVGDDPTGDALLLALARARIGHVAVLRDAVHPTPQRLDGPAVGEAAEAVVAEEAEVAAAAAVWVDGVEVPPGLEPADVELALRYLTDFRVLVAVHPTPAALGVAVAAAEFAGAHVVAVTEDADEPPAGLPASALLVAIEDATADSDGIAGRIGAYAAAVDRGEAPDAAFATLREPAGDELPT